MRLRDFCSFTALKFTVFTERQITSFENQSNLALTVIALGGALSTPHNDQELSRMKNYPAHDDMVETIHRNPSCIFQ